MLRIVKLGGVTAGLGIVVGLGLVGWIRLHGHAAASVSSDGKPVVLDMSATPEPKKQSAEDLHVASPSKVAAAGGSPDSLLGGTGSGGASSNTPTPKPGSSAPSPDDFKQYDQYKDKDNAFFGDEVVGTGPQAVLGSTLAVQYKGWLTDGRLFDDSYARNEPYIFKLGEHKVIPGWEEGLLGMKVGGKRRLIVPPAVGYGEQGHDPIPPNAVLVFDVELVAVQ